MIMPSPHQRDRPSSGMFFSARERGGARLPGRLRTCTDSLTPQTTGTASKVAAGARPSPRHARFTSTWKCQEDSTFRVEGPPCIGRVEGESNQKYRLASDITDKPSRHLRYRFTDTLQRCAREKRPPYHDTGVLQWTRGTRLVSKLFCLDHPKSAHAEISNKHQPLGAVPEVLRRNSLTASFLGG